MTSFRYEAVSAYGKLITGEMEAATRDDLVARLQRSGNVPIRAEPAVPRRRVLAGRSPRRPLAWKRVELARTTQRLSALLEAGLPVDRALEIAATNANANEAQSLSAVLERVRGGASLADALAADPRAFPRFYVGMVRAGEAGATLDTTLRDLSALLERAAGLHERVKSALIYPSLVLVTCLASVGMLFLFVIPQFRPILDQTDVELPPVAAAVFALADFSRHWWWAAFVLLGIAALAALRAVDHPPTRARLDRFILHVPLVGGIVAKIETARFSGTLGTLLHNGVAPVPALAIANETIGNAAFANALALLPNRLREGKGWADPIDDARIFPPLAVQLIRVGEETARLEAMLLKVGEIYSEETERSIERLLALLVPGITILLGLIVAVAIGSIFTAILNVYQFAL
jgi:general secretion pathway protein F